MAPGEGRSAGIKLSERQLHLATLTCRNVDKCARNPFVHCALNEICDLQLQIAHRHEIHNGSFLHKLKREGQKEKSTEKELVRPTQLHFRMMSSKVFAFLISALLARCSLCSPRGIIGPAVRPENADYGDGGKSTEVTLDDDQAAAGSFPSDLEGMLYYPPEQRAKRHADGLFNTAYRKALGQLSARKYLHSLVAKRIGGGSSAELESFSKRHVDGVFTNGYSRYRKQMAVKKYLAAILGTSPEDLDLHQVLRGLDLGELPDADDLELHAILWEWLQQVPSQLPAL